MEVFLKFGKKIYEDLAFCTLCACNRLEKCLNELQNKRVRKKNTDKNYKKEVARFYIPHDFILTLKMLIILIYGFFSKFKYFRLEEFAQEYTLEMNFLEKNDKDINIFSFINSGFSLPLNVRCWTSRSRWGRNSLKSSP